MSSVTVAASPASYRRGAPRLRVNDLGWLATVARSIAVMMTAVCYSAGVRGSRIGMSYFKIPLSLRAMISFFSLAPFSAGLAPLYVNAGARMMLAMGGARVPSQAARDSSQAARVPSKRLRVVDVKDLTHTPQSASTSV
jgi:hypothetical protein